MGDDTKTPLKDLFDSLPPGKHILIDLSGNVAKLDSATNTMQVMEYEHHEIHDGNSFVAHFDNTTSSDDDHRTAIGIVTSATTKWMHVIVSVIASSAAEFSLFEDPTINNDVGTQATIYNRDRNSDKESLTTDVSATPEANKFETYIEANLATLTGGTLIEHTLLAGGEGKKAIGGSSRGSQEFILKQGTKYVFELKNIGATENRHEIHLDWYEHTNG